MGNTICKCQETPNLERINDTYVFSPNYDVECKFVNNTPTPYSMKEKNSKLKNSPSAG